MCSGCKLYLISLAALVCGCSVKLPELTFTGEKTALENQVLGAYQQLESDSWLIASTRSFNSHGPELSAPKQEVLEAVQNRKFNKDDVDELKRAKVVGEDNRGYLAILGNEAYREKPEYKQFVDQIVLEENHDRQIVFERIMAVSLSASQAGSAKVSDIFAKLNVDASEPGTLIQTPDGKWIEKAKPGK